MTDGGAKIVESLLGGPLETPKKKGIKDPPGAKKKVAKKKVAKKKVAAKPGAEDGDRVLHIAIGDLHAWDVCEAVRRDVDGDALNSLKTNIAEHGISSPIWVAEMDGGDYAVIAGYRRLRAATELDIATVPCIVKEVTDPDDAKMLAILENTSRDDLREMDAFRTISYLRTRFADRLVFDKGQRGVKKGDTNAAVLAGIIGRSEFWARQHARAFDRFGIDILEKVDKKIRAESASGRRQITWNKVLQASIHPDADAYEDQIRQMVGEAVEPRETPTEPTDSTKQLLSDREVFIPVKFDALDRAGVVVKLGAKPGEGVEDLKVRVTLEMGFKLGKTGFLNGERGSQKLSKMFGTAAEKINAVGLLGAGNEPSDNEIKVRQGIREALESAVEKLSARVQ